MNSHHRFQILSKQDPQRRHVIGTLLSFAALACLPACSRKSSHGKSNPNASKQRLSPDGNPNPNQDDRCPMCAMRVADHPGWVGAIELNDGTTFYTCSVRCTLATSMNTEPFLGVPKNTVQRVRVPHYLEKNKSLDAQEAWYVIDSDVRGPMGLALLPAKSEEEAKVLVRRHNGRAIPRKDVTMDVLKDLKQRSKSP